MQLGWTTVFEVPCSRDQILITPPLWCQGRRGTTMVIGECITGKPMANTGTVLITVVVAAGWMVIGCGDGARTVAEPARSRPAGVEPASERQRTPDSKGLGTGGTRVVKIEEEWREELTAEEYRILRKKGTERVFSSPLNDVKEAGSFVCAGCGQPLFSSEQKYDSGTGWPSFWAPVDDEAIQTAQDNSLFVRRTEVLCSRCGGHLGHVFEDGPDPTGLRYCINGVALAFVPEHS